MSNNFEIPYFPEIEGLGTTYEAFITSSFLKTFVRKKGIKSVCEYPVCTFRVPGSIGVFLALIGCDVSLASTDEDTLRKAGILSRKYNVEDKVNLIRIGSNRIKSESFDLVFHISLLPTMKRDLGIEPFSCLQEMTNLTKKYIIVTNHNLHYSIPVDRMLSWMTSTPTQFGELELVGSKPVKQMLHKLGLVIQDEFFFDTPPWMAIDLSKIFPRIRLYSTRITGSQSKNPKIDNRMISNKMRRFSFIEDSSLPQIIKGIFAHHVALIAEKKGNVK